MNKQNNNKEIKFSNREFTKLVEAEELLRGYILWLNEVTDEQSKLKRVFQFFDESQEINFYSFIFESNNIENEGLDKASTQKLVNESWKIWTEFINNNSSEFITFFSHLTDFSKVSFSENLHEEIWNTIETKILNQTNDDIAKEFGLPPQFMYNGYFKDAQIAFNQFIALIYANTISYSNIAKTMRLNKKKFNRIKTFSRILMFCKKYKFRFAYKLLNAFKNYNISVPEIINEVQLKRLHHILANRTDNNQNGEPGQYRPEHARIGFDVTFMEPSLIEVCIKTQLSKSYERIKRGNFSFFLEGCRLSEEIVKIHPFGDYNGRLSRIILSMFLHRAGYPFFLILRSDSRNKKDYINAMIKSYNGNSSDYIDLVCKSFINQIEVINSKLSTAGLPLIKRRQLKDKDKDLLFTKLKNIKDLNNSFK